MKWYSMLDYCLHWLMPMPTSHNDIFIVVSDVVLNMCIPILGIGGQISALTVWGINSSSEGI